MPNYELKPINTCQLSEFQEWTDQYGMVQNNADNDTTGNGNLYLAHYVAGLALKGILTEREAFRLKSVYLNNMRLPGLLMRKPNGQNDYQAHDDYFGLLSADKFLNIGGLWPRKRFTKDTYNYGANTYCDGVDDKEQDPAKIALNNQWYGYLVKVFKKVRWVFNTVNPGKFHVSSWLGRRMEFIATLQMSAEVPVNPIYWLYWAATMLWLVKFPNKSDNNGYILSWHSALACQGYGPLTDKICLQVREAIHRDWGDMGQLLNNYFNNPNHPLVKLLTGIW